MSIKLFKRTENTDKKLCMGRSRVAHEFNSRNYLRRGSSRCAKKEFMDGATLVSVRGDAGDLLGGAEKGREKGSASGKGSEGSRK